VTAGEFESFSTGKTLYFEQQGEAFGAEQYFPNRQVLWQYSDGTCAYGEWFTDGPDLCFSYENSGPPQCWTFTRRDGDFFARERGRPSGDPAELRLSGSNKEPLACQAPDLGV